MKQKMKVAVESPAPACPNARLASLQAIMDTVVAAYFDPPPSKEALREWFDRAGIARFQANPLAKRGGGPVYYSVPAVEKFLKSRITLPFNRPGVQS